MECDVTCSNRRDVAGVVDKINEYLQIGGHES